MSENGINDSQSDSNASPSQSGDEEGNYIESMDEILRVELSKNDYEKDKQAIEN